MQSQAEARAVAVFTGPLAAASRLYEELRRDRPASLEAALANTRARLAQAAGLMPGEPMELVIVGWSEPQGRAEGWLLVPAGEPLLIGAGESYHRPLPEPSSPADCARLDELAAAAAEGRLVPAYHLGCARVITRHDFAGGALWTAEVSEAGVTLHRTGELPC